MSELAKKIDAVRVALVRRSEALSGLIVEGMVADTYDDLSLAQQRIDDAIETLAIRASSVAFVTKCNVCGGELNSVDEEAMGMCERCASE